jgi:choline/glycine/proline betaine transport protein
VTEEQEVAGRRVRASSRGARTPVFGLSALGIAAVLGYALALTQEAETLFLGLQDVIAQDLGWFYVLGVSFFLVFALWIGVSRYGHVRLGPDGEEPEYSRGSWFAMLFSAGMGIGILFYGVAEPMFHFTSPPVGEPRTVEAARTAMRFTFFHWGLHAWAIYVVMGLSLGYFHHRRGLPLAIRSALSPLLGHRAFGPMGHAVDSLAVFGTVFGLATSLGLGAMQVNAGLAHLFGVPMGTGVQIALIAGITGCATLSLVAGLDAGIRRLSIFNMAIALVLLVFVFAAGPTLFLLDSFPDHLGRYLQHVVGMSLWTGSLRGDVDGWRTSWTIFYWAWWIAWSPFVGMFIARVSRGRTIREFVAGVLLVPTLLSFVWFTVFGGTALHMELFGAGGIAAAVENDLAVAVYQMLEQLPLAGLTSALAVVVVSTFFVTSSDSGSFVVDVLTSGGHPDPPVWQRIFWALTEGVVAAVLLVTGGLAALQSAAIITGLPFCAVLVAMAFALIRVLRHDESGEVIRAATAPRATAEVPEASAAAGGRRR